MAKARPLSRTSRAKARPKVTDNAYGPARAERVTQDPLAARLLTDLLAESARRHPRRIALIYYSRQISYSGLWQDVTYCASGLQALGVRRGDRVALMS